MGSSQAARQELQEKKFPLNRICLTISPISQASLERLQIESERYYRELTIPSNAPFWLRDEDSFLYKNQADILWMEGKLAGLPLKAEYRQYRAEGEWQLAVAILLPFTSVAMLSGFGISKIQIAIACIVIVSLSIKLAGYGLYYYRRANSLIAHHIADGSLMTPAMETASRICSSQDVSN
ncbi:hypothetical protein J5X07_03885 [Actinomyces bowdenii]|uniref:hypothetical protein n=1 Tax=Actinomyces bowdenii TaxID=131109 RepID=UPI001ABC470A|nr:hypothetical protein [Actinomyces bowdenii]MBO3724176.1 hypothetical protein [Actinomyces bowdenii]